MNQLAKTKATLKSDAFMNAIANVLPKHVSPDRMAQIYITAITKVPLLQECDQGSLFKCLMSLSAWGLEPNGHHAHLIPFRNNKKGIVECQLILDYKGLVELVHRSGKVSSIHSTIICAGDTFDYDKGEVLTHKPYWLCDESTYAECDDPAAVIGALCHVTFKDGATKTELMSRKEIDAVRSRSRSARSGPWVTDFAEMAKKTVFKRCAKYLPLSPEMVDAYQSDYDSPQLRRDEPEATVSPEAFDALLAGNVEDEAATVDADDQAKE